MNASLYHYQEAKQTQTPENGEKYSSGQCPTSIVFCSAVLKSHIPGPLYFFFLRFFSLGAGAMIS